MSIARTDARLYFQNFGITLNSTDINLRLECFSCGKQLAEYSTTYLRCSNLHLYTYHNAVMIHAQYMAQTVENFRTCDAPPY